MMCVFANARAQRAAILCTYTVIYCMHTTNMFKGLHLQLIECQGLFPHLHRVTKASIDGAKVPFMFMSNIDNASSLKRLRKNHNSIGSWPTPGSLGRVLNRKKTKHVKKISGGNLRRGYPKTDSQVCSRCCGWINRKCVVWEKRSNKQSTEKGSSETVH